VVGISGVTEPGAEGELQSGLRNGTGRLGATWAKLRVMFNIT
jgi:hypothetical protein